MNAILLKKGKTIELDDQIDKAPVLIEEVAMAVKSIFLKSGFIELESEYQVTDYKWAQIIAEEFGLERQLISKQKKMDSLLNTAGPTEQGENKKSNYEKTSKYKFTDIYDGTKILRKQIYCAFNLIYQNNPTETVFGVNVGEFRYKLGYNLGQKIKKPLYDKIDYVVPVPNSGLYYAMGVAGGMGKPYLQSLIKPDLSARSLHIEDISLREELIYNKILPIKELIRGKRLLLVDEAIFTGTTLCVVFDMVRACGAKSISIAIPTPISKNNCKQYILPKRKLLSEFVNIDEIKDYFKVENIFFQDFDIFYQYIKGVNNICYECFDK